MTRGAGSRVVAAALVVFLHAALLLRIADDPPPPRKRTFDVQLQPDITFVERGEDTLPGVTSDCPNHYFGVGLKHDFSNRVIDIARGYPAERAGIRVQDVVTFSPEPIIRPGERREFRVERGAVTFTVSIVSEKICHR